MAYFKKGILVGVSLLAMSSASYAAVINKSVSTTGGSAAAFAGLQAPGSQTLQLPSFDATLGTLNSVSLAFTVNTLVDNTVANASRTATGSYGNLGGTTTFTLTGPGGQIIGAGTAAQSGLAGNIGTFSVIDAGSSTNTTSGSVTPTSTAPFIGTSSSTVAFSFSAPVAAVTGPPTQTIDLSFAALGFGDATVTATYNFTAPPPPPTGTPEPASMALIGAGLVGLGMARRRKA